MKAKKTSGWIIIDNEITKSTNDDALNFALPESGSKRFIFSAKKQTGGRGRLGRKWQNGEGNLMFSAIVPCDNENSGILALVCGICVLETIKCFAPQAEIKLKWPNDILLEDKKVCGILLERKDEKYMVAGIGVNIKNAPILKNSLYQAASLQNCGIFVTREDFLAKFLEIFNEWLEKIARKELVTIKETWIKNAKGINKKIEIENIKGKITGKLIGVDDNGALILEESGNTVTILTGDVHYL